MTARRLGNLLVLSAPSGAGKSSLVRRVLDIVPDLVFSVSATTRAARPGERDGRDYHFVDRARFAAMVANGELLEHAEVHGNLYGTLRGTTERELAEGRDLLLEIDVQGARQVKASGVGACSIFILPPSRTVLEQRLRGRGADTEASIATRLAAATTEVAAIGAFDFVIVNDEMEAAARRLASVLLALREARRAQAPVIADVLATFGLVPGGEGQGETGAVRELLS